MENGLIQRDPYEHNHSNNMNPHKLRFSYIEVIPIIRSISPDKAKLRIIVNVDRLILFLKFITPKIKPNNRVPHYKISAIDLGNFLMAFEVRPLWLL